MTSSFFISNTEDELTYLYCLYVLYLVLQLLQNFNCLFIFWFGVQENDETNELKIKLEDLSQMYESTVDELQTVKLDYDDLLHQKV